MLGHTLTAAPASTSAGLQVRHAYDAQPGRISQQKGRTQEAHVQGHDFAGCAEQVAVLQQHGAGARVKAGAVQRDATPPVCKVVRDRHGAWVRLDRQQALGGACRRGGTSASCGRHTRSKSWVPPWLMTGQVSVSVQRKLQASAAGLQAKQGTLRHI